MKRTAYISLIFFICLTQSVWSQPPEDLVQIAIQQNPGLQARFVEFEAALQKIPQISLPDPNLTVSAFGQMVETRVGPQRARFSLTQMFPWFGTLAAQKDAASAMAEARFQAYRVAQNELIFSVKSAWYPIWELERSLQVQQRNLEVLDAYKTLATSKFRNGKAPMVDVIRTDIMISAIESDIRIMEAKRRPLHTQLNRLLNREDTISIRIPDSVLVNPPVNGFPVDSLFADNPRLSEWDQLIRSAKASERAAIKSGMPRFGAGLDYIIVGERTDASPPGNGQDAIMPMVSVSLPIFRKKYEAAKKEARLMQSAYSLKKAETANMLAAGYEMAWFEWGKANEMLALYKTQTQQTQQAIDLLLHAYSQSGANFEEILRLQQDLLKYELATAAATTDFLLALAKIDFITAKDLKNEDLR